MNHFPRNVKQYELVQKIPTPDQVDKMLEPKMLGLIYKAVFYCLSVLLDIRFNTSQAKPKPFKKVKKVDNPVIREDMNIEVKR